MDVRVFRRTDNTFEEWRDYWDGTMKRGNLRLMERGKRQERERLATRKREVGDEEG